MRASFSETREDDVCMLLFMPFKFPISDQSNFDLDYVSTWHRRHTAFAAEFAGNRVSLTFLPEKEVDDLSRLMWGLTWWWLLRWLRFKIEWTLKSLMVIRLNVRGYFECDVVKFSRWWSDSWVTDETLLIVNVITEKDALGSLSRIAMTYEHDRVLLLENCLFVRRVSSARPSQKTEMNHD